MALVEPTLKSPSIPLYSKGDVSFQDSTPLWKSGEGEIFGECGWNYIANFWVTTLAGHRINGAKTAERIFVGLFTFVVFLCHSSSVAPEGGD
jgi:hypothetical protein